jgi:hypothetical protein
MLGRGFHVIKSAHLRHDNSVMFESVEIWLILLVHVHLRFSMISQALLIQFASMNYLVNDDIGVSDNLGTVCGFGSFNVTAEANERLALSNTLIHS